MKRLILGLVALTANIALAAPGDRSIRNPNQDGNLSICVNDGGVETCPMIIDGATGKVATMEVAGGSNFEGLLTVTGATLDGSRIRVNATGTGGTNQPGLEFYNEGSSGGAIYYTENNSSVDVLVGGSFQQRITASSVDFQDNSLTTDGNVSFGNTAVSSTRKVTIVKDASQNQSLYIIRPSVDTNTTAAHLVLQSQTSGSTDGDSFVLMGTQSYNWAVGLENTTGEYRFVSNTAVDSDGLGTAFSQTRLSITPSGTVTLRSVESSEGDAYGQIVLRSGTAFNGTPRPGIIFQIEQDATPSLAYVASIYAEKLNTTSGDRRTSLKFATRDSSGTTAERMRIREDGDLEAKIGSDGNCGIGNICSGNYTPTPTGISNVSTVTCDAGFFYRIGHLVHMMATCPLTPTATATTTQYRMTIPIARTSGNFTSENQAVGTCSQDSTGSIPNDAFVVRAVSATELVSAVTQQVSFNISRRVYCHLTYKLTN